MRKTLGLGLCLLTLGACAQWDISTTERTATEQLLLSTSTDRALRQCELPLEGRRVYLNTDYLKTYDQEYVVAAIRERIGKSGRLVNKRADAEVLVEARAGALAIDTSKSLIGIPAIPLPVGALAGQENAVVETPEIALFKLTGQRATAKIALFARDAATSRPLATTGPLLGRAYCKQWVILLLPFTTTDLPRAPRPAESANPGRVEAPWIAEKVIERGAGTFKWRSESR